MTAGGPAVTKSVGDEQASIVSRALRAASELDLITPAESTHAVGRVIDDVSATARITCGSQAWIATHAGGQATPDNNWRAELAVHRAAHRLGTSSLLPTFAGYSPTNQVLLTCALSEKWRSLQSVDLRSPWSVELFARAATGLARWHQSSQSLNVLEPTLPWLLAMLRDDHLETSWHRSEVNALVTDVLGDRVLRTALETVANAWQAQHVIHGDVQLASVMCHEDGDVKLTGWGAVGLGDPRWDVAGLLQELVVAEQQDAPLGLDTSAHRLAVLNAYRDRATSPSALHEDDETLRAFVVSRMLVRATQIQSSGNGAETAQSYVGAAHRLAE